MNSDIADEVRKKIDEQNLKTGCYHDVEVENGQVVVIPANPQDILMSGMLKRTILVVVSYKLGTYVSTTEDGKPCLIIY